MIETERLILRGWREDDMEPFAAMGHDAEAMRFLGGGVDSAATEGAVERQRASQLREGHCFWATERRDDAAFFGFCGLRIGGHAGTAVSEELEIGWRLRRDAWGFGYAHEASAASLDWGWRHTNRSRIAAWTVPDNVASWGLMRRLGMTHRAELDSNHSGFEKEPPLRRHLVYAIERPR